MGQSHDTATVTIADIGTRAARLLQHASKGTIAAVFQRSFYLAFDDRTVLCIAAPDLGRGPLTLSCTDTARASWLDAGLEPGQRGAITPATLAIEDGPAFDLTRARVWTPPPWPPRPPADALRTALDVARAVSAPLVPGDSLAATILMPGRTAATSAIARAAARAASLPLATLADWLETAAGGDPNLDAAAADAARSLIGLGAGLTPAGDDLLSGLLIALRALGRPRDADHLAAAIAAAPDDATSPISRAFLDCAAAGEAAEPLHAIIAALFAGDADAIAAALPAIARTGHSSGFDMLAGALLALDAHADERNG